VIIGNTEYFFFQHIDLLDLGFLLVKDYIDISMNEFIDMFEIGEPFKDPLLSPF